MSTGHKRSRNGCQSCRLRRRKCDGSRPVCSNCNKKNSTCVWGLKASFHPSRLLILSNSDEKALETVETERQRANRGQKRVNASRIVDNTPEIIRAYENSPKLAPNGSRVYAGISDDEDESSSSEPSDSPVLSSKTIGSQLITLNPDNTHLASSGVTGIYPAIVGGFPTNSEASSHMPVESAGNDIDIPVDLDHIFDDGPESNLFGSVIFTESFPPPFSLGLALAQNSSPFCEPDFPIDEEQTMMLVRSFLSESATWCETTDTSKQFSVVCAHDMLEHKIFKASALALACRQLSVTGFPVVDVALQLYQYTIQLLIQQDPDKADAFILAACTLLCVYEMMASEVSDWRRHLKGCAGLFSSKKWNGNSVGLIKTCFWAFARIDTWAAFLLGKRTLIPTNYWVAHESLQITATMECPDDYCNLSILNFARVVNCLGRDENESTTPESSIGVQRLWQRFQEWWDLRPKRARPLFRMDPTNSNPFPVLMFTHAAAICGNTFYHAGCLLLLNKLGVKVGASAGKLVADPVWHAKELCGISVSNNDHANWVNHLQPLFIAGQVFGPAQRRDSKEIMKGSLFGSRLGTQLDAFNSGGEDRGDEVSRFAAEQIALLKHLIRIQRETGWKTESRAQELRILWGLE